MGLHVGDMDGDRVGDRVGDWVGDRVGHFHLDEVFVAALGVKVFELFSSG